MNLRISIHRPSPIAHRTSTAFTLVENMLAMLIFALGLITIAGIFPTAILLQKRTVDQVLTQQAGRDAQAMLYARRPTAADTTAAYTGTLAGPVVPWANLTFNTTVKSWTLTDRTGPSVSTQTTRRETLWVPFLRRNTATPSGTSSDWDVYVFVLRKGASLTYATGSVIAPDTWANATDGTAMPGVRSRSVTPNVANPLRLSIAGLATLAQVQANFAVGDKFLDQYGGIHTVSEIDTTLPGIIITSPLSMDNNASTTANRIWYAPPATSGGSSPLMELRRLTASDVVQ